MKRYVLILSIVLLAIGGCKKKSSNPITPPSSTFTLTPVAGSNGTIVPSTPVTLEYGGSQSFIITPDSGFEVDSVFIDGAEVDSLISYTFINVTANHTIRVAFSRFAAEQWNFPKSEVKFGISLVTEDSTVNSGSRFDVSIVFYNLTGVFGTALEINFPNDKVGVRDIITGPYFSGGSVLVIKKVDAASGRASYGATFTAGSGSTVTGSGIVLKLKCRAKLTGSGSFTINPGKLEIIQSDGTSILNFSTIQIENLVMGIQ